MLRMLGGVPSASGAGLPASSVTFAEIAASAVAGTNRPIATVSVARVLPPTFMFCLLP